MKPLSELLRRHAAILIFLGTLASAQANNITVGGMSLVNINTTTHTLNVQFNVSWENSWFLNPGSPPGNYDAAWLVVKYQIGDNVWHTATLDPNPAAHIIPGGFAITVGTNSGPRAVGVFLHRNAAGSGTAVATGVQLRWNYGSDGVADSSLITAEIHAIEMVYVPSGSFTVGDGTALSYFRTSTNLTPFTITSAGPISAGTATGALRVGPNNGSGAYSIPNTFPNGFNSFYMMKYEVSQDQYVDFLNKTKTVGTASSQFDRQTFSGATPD